MEQILGGRPSSWGRNIHAQRRMTPIRKLNGLRSSMQEAPNRHPHLFRFLTADVGMERILVLFLPLGAVSALRSAGEDYIPVQDGCARAQVDFFDFFDFFGSIRLDQALTSGSQFLPTG